MIKSNNMEIRTLRYFLAVAREENMSKAAELLHVSQPALSKAVKSLEEELGKKLFVRHSFSIELTKEGALLRKRAEDLVSLADRIEKEFVSLDDDLSGELYLGLAESYQIADLARQIRQMKVRYPDLHYHITSGDTEQLIDKLNSGVLDFLVIAQEPDTSVYEALEFPKKDIWGLVFPKDDPLAKKDRITINDLKGLPLFCSMQGWENEIRNWAKNDFKDLELEGTFRLSYNGSLFAKERLGYLLTFDRLIDTSKDSGLVFRPLYPTLENKLYLIWNPFQTFTKAAESFLEQIKRSFHSERIG